jgi:hypothetical protein
MMRLIAIFLSAVITLPIFAGCTRPPRNTGGQGVAAEPPLRTEIIEEEEELGREYRPVVEPDK